MPDAPWMRCLQLCIFAICLLIGPLAFVDQRATAAGAARPPRVVAIERRVRPRLELELAAARLHYGAAAYLRIFKQESQLELWLRDKSEYRLFKTYPICTWSGKLGPKLREGDGQAPEGFYDVRAGQLNPSSLYNLSFNLGYPNAFDRANHRTGSALMVHGDCVSIGCYAMGDGNIEEIYLLMEAALSNGAGTVPVHIFPFRFSGADDPRIAASNWAEFWSDLNLAAQAFEHDHLPPKISVHGTRYAIEP